MLELNQPADEVNRQIRCSPDSAEVNLNFPLGANFWPKTLLPEGISYKRMSPSSNKNELESLAKRKLI